MARPRSRARAHLVEGETELLRSATAARGTSAGDARSGWTGNALKRATDLVLACLMLVCLAPLIILVAIAIRVDSPGPVFFRQRRVGRDGDEFTVLKFRSMSAGATSEAHHQYITALASSAGPSADGGLRKLTKDSRVTRVGAFVRKTSIDEWPQLLNVLAGHMAIVGPRPAVVYELEFYRPEHFARFTVRPGITGLWQVSGRNQLGFLEMLDLDVEYVRRQGFGYDLWLMARTPLAILRAHTA
jgi:lipopolysaccharide/colanic/teichoic acid biosynthesis glycosyltransferase